MSLSLGSQPFIQENLKLSFPLLSPEHIIFPNADSVYILHIKKLTDTQTFSNN